MKTTLFSLTAGFTAVYLGFSFVCGMCAADAPVDNVPPEGFRALFDGKGLDGWTEKKAVPEHWSAQEGCLVYDGMGTHLYTAEEFSNFVLLVDWKVPRRGNSGVFLRGGTQVEINDGDSPDRPIWNGTTGGIYPDLPPIKRAAKTFGEWNHYEIRVEKGVITVFLNGEKTLDAYAKNWGKAFTGPIGFQHHGSPLWFKNIYVRALPE